MKLTHLSILCCGLLPLTVFSTPKWTDRQHANIQNALHSWSNRIDRWIGVPDPNKPASANLRIMLDNEWNHYDGYSIKPRIRGKIKLPTLKQRLNVVFGDEDLDNQSRDKHQLHPNYRQALSGDKKYDQRQVRQDNASLALRWSDGINALGIDSDLDVGIRSGADIFLRLRLNKVWQYSENIQGKIEQIYRYGINSKHYLRTNLEHKFSGWNHSFITNHTFVEYRHDNDESLYWGNSLYRQHNFPGYQRLNYGFFAGGQIEHRSPTLQFYGPFINWRQPIWWQWLFIQPELHFYNDKKANRKHHLGAFLRLEAIF